MKKSTLVLVLLAASAPSIAQDASMQPTFVLNNGGPTGEVVLEAIKFPSGHEFQEFIHADSVTNFTFSGSAGETRVISATDPSKRHRVMGPGDFAAFNDYILEAFQSNDLNHFIDNGGSNPSFSFDVHFNKPIKDNDPGTIDEIGEIIFFERGAHTANSFIVLEGLDEHGNRIGNTVLVHPDEPVNCTPPAEIGVYKNDLSYAGWYQEMGGVSVDLDRFGLTELQHLRVRSARVGSDGLTSHMVSGMGRDLNPDFKLIAVQTYDVALPAWAVGD